MAWLPLKHEIIHAPFCLPWFENRSEEGTPRHRRTGFSSLLTGLDGPSICIVKPLLVKLDVGRKHFTCHLLLFYLKQKLRSCRKLAENWQTFPIPFTDGRNRNWMAWFPIPGSSSRRKKKEKARTSLEFPHSNPYSPNHIHSDGFCLLHILSCDHNRVVWILWLLHFKGWGRRCSQEREEIMPISKQGYVFWFDLSN